MMIQHEAPAQKISIYTIGVCLVAALGGLLFGYDTAVIAGATGMGLSLMAMGLAAQFQTVSLWMLLLIVSYMACFALSVGPVTWVLLSEIFPTRIRGRALSVATFCLWWANFIVSQTFPMLDENPWLISRFNHGFPFYIYAGFCLILVLVVWKFIPETKGRTLEEIEKFWIVKTQEK